MEATTHSTADSGGTASTLPCSNDLLDWLLTSTFRSVYSYSCVTLRCLSYTSVTVTTLSFDSQSGFLTLLLTPRSSPPLSNACLSLPADNSYTGFGWAP